MSNANSRKIDVRVWSEESTFFVLGGVYMLLSLHSHSDEVNAKSSVKE